MRSPQDDDTLDKLRSWHAGDRTALDALVSDNLTWIADHIHRNLRPALRLTGQTEDFVQQAMLAVLEYGPKFEVSDRARFRALVARIVENDLRDQHRFLHRECRDVRRNVGAATDTVLNLDPAARSVTTPSAAAEREERRAWLRLALDLLDPEDREAIRMRDWEELTFREAGERLGIGEDGARKRYDRALPKLAKKVALLRDGKIDSAVAAED